VVHCVGLPGPDYGILWLAMYRVRGTYSANMPAGLALAHQDQSPREIVILAILRSSGAVVAGLVLAMVLIVAVEAVTNTLHPFPAGVELTHEVICNHVAKFPSWVLAVGTVLWASTVFVSSWLATRLGARRHSAHGILIGILLFAAAAFNMSMLPYPIWFEVVTLASFVLATFLGCKLGRGKANRNVCPT